MDLQKSQWECSYLNRDNFVFYPHEEVIRFISRNVRKRVGLNEFRDMRTPAGGRLLDLGCGIGRHVIYGHEMGLDAYGIDLSETAIATARTWASRIGADHLRERLVQGDIRQLPWESGFFNFVVSHGVLDSMHFEVARSACCEVARVLADDGIFYCDVISGDDSSHAREYDGEETVASAHEEGTIQSYFNFAKILRLVEGLFILDECQLIRNENVLNGSYHARYHLVLKKR